MRWRRNAGGRNHPGVPINRAYGREPGEAQGSVNMSARKTKKRQGAEAPGRCRKTIHLPAEQAKLLAAVAGWLEMTESDFVSEALIPALKGWYVANRPGRQPGEPPSEGPPSAPPAE